MTGKQHVGAVFSLVLESNKVNYRKYNKSVVNINNFFLGWSAKLNKTLETRLLPPTPSAEAPGDGVGLFAIAMPLCSSKWHHQ